MIYDLVMPNAHNITAQIIRLSMTYVRRGERTVLVVVPPWWALGSELSTVVPDSPLSASLRLSLTHKGPRWQL